MRQMLIFSVFRKVRCRKDSLILSCQDTISTGIMQMLDAIQAQEDKTQEKLKEKQGVVVRGKKNW